MASVQDIITSALRLLGIYGATEIPDAADLSDSLRLMNLMIDQWNAEHLMVFTKLTRVLPLTVGVQSYTIGTGGSFAYPRPAKIESAGLLRTISGVRHDMQLDTSVSWAQIPEKLVSGKLPLRMYCDYGYPLAKMQVWPAPSEPCSLEIYVWNALTTPMVIGDIFDFPPGYANALLYNLTVEIAPFFGRDPGSVITAIAQQTKGVVMGLNASMFAGTQDPPAPPAAA